MAAGFAAAALAVVRWRETARGWVVAGLAGGLLLATKQYAPLLALPLALAAPSAGRWRAAGLALASLGLTLLPFAVWNPGELWRDLAMAQVLQPFRWDALSWLVPVARALGRPTSALWGFAAAGLVVAGTLRARPSPAQAARVAGAAFLALVLFNKQAFCNYYWLGAFLLLAAFALAEREAAAIA